MSFRVSFQSCPKEAFRKKKRKKPTLCLAEEKPFRKGAAVPRPAFVSPLARSVEEICKKMDSFCLSSAHRHTPTHADAPSKGNDLIYFFKAQLLSKLAHVFTQQHFNVCDGQSIANRSLCQGLAARICPCLWNVTRSRQPPMAPSRNKLFLKHKMFSSTITVIIKKKNQRVAGVC